MNRRKFITHTGCIFATALIPGSFLTINCKGKNADAGFSFHPHHCQVNHNSIRISKKYKESDMQGTLMCLECLRYADEWNNS